METQAAVLWGQNEDWKIETIELDPPKAGEVLVKLAASGMCHSDEHFRTGDLGGIYPIIGGHEGAGVVEEVGPGVTDLAPGRPRRLRLHPGLRQVPFVRPRPLQPVRRRGHPDDGHPVRRHPPPPLPQRNRPDHRGLPGHLRPPHRGEPGVVREDPPPLPAGQGLPDRLRRHHRLGIRRLHGRGQARRRRGGHRHRRPRDLGHPGRQAGWSRADLRGGPGRRSSGSRPSSSGPPTWPPASRRPRRWSTKSPGARTPTR